MPLDRLLAPSRSDRLASRRLTTAALVAILALTTVLPAGADVASAERELEEAQARREAVEERLATQAGDLEGLEEAIHEAEDDLRALEQEQAALGAELAELERGVASRARLAYMRGDPSAIQLLVTGADPAEVGERAVMLESLALRDRAAGEAIDVVRVALELNREERAAAVAALDDQRTAMEELVEQLAADLEQLRQDEIRFADELEEARAEARRRAEEERRRREAQERARRAGTPTGGSGGSSGGSSGAGGLACPVGNPVVFADTWGAPRSGGRSHKGVDMMAPHGTPVFAITSGKVTRMNGNRLGGISLYMFGDDGNQYYYTHLQGYASGTSVGQRVEAGTLIAFVGSTGNASASAPHLHLEVHPGGGGPVNPYPFAARACGR